MDEVLNNGGLDTRPSIGLRRGNFCVIFDDLDEIFASHATMHETRNKSIILITTKTHPTLSNSPAFQQPENAVHYTLFKATENSANSHTIQPHLLF